MELIKEYIEKTHLVEHQIYSYNDFVSNGLQNIVNSTKELPIKCKNHDISIGQIYLDNPRYI